MLNKILTSILTAIFMAGFSQCSNSKKLQKEVSFSLGQVYYQHWVAGVQGGGSGVNLFIPIKENKNNVVLDSVYFNNNASKLETKPTSPNLYIGRFQLNNNKKDIVMSNDLNKEYGNTLPQNNVKSPIKLSKNECLISYHENGKTKYYKIQGVVEKPPLQYPSAPPKNP